MPDEGWMSLLTDGSAVFLLCIGLFFVVLVGWLLIRKEGGE